MAAGEGTRMRSALPKVLHPICGRPMLAWSIEAALEAGAGRIGVIVSPGRDISSALPEDVTIIEQPVANGTGGAVQAAKQQIEAAAEEGAAIVVLSGDVPLISAETITELLTRHAEAGAAATVMSAVLEEPGSYGRIVRDAGGDFKRIVETKAAGDASAEELEIREVNAGVYAFEAAALLPALDRITNDNAQGEYYLPDTLQAIAGAGGRIAIYTADDPAVMLGINNRADLALVEAEARRRILHSHMLAGVTVVDPASTWIDAEVRIEPDTTILPGCSLRGATSIGSGSVIGPVSTLTDAVVGEQVTVLHSYLVGCEIESGCTVGPFAYLRPGAVLRAGAKAGTFVEIKNSDLGPGSKVPHLSYIGDADIGAGANIGAGTITANYDGFRKHRTKIGEGARVGVDTMLIAPVEIGADAYTAGGSVISKDVPDGALGISRSQQRNVENFADRKSAMASKEKDS